jgi:opacity protein-like surface antigen
MFRWTWLVWTLGLVASAGAAEPDTGRTDGPEGSEYGTGGYRYYGLGGRYFLESFFGSARVDVEVEEVEDLDHSSQTDLLGGFNVGYQIEEGLSFLLGFGYISEQKISLFSGGMRTNYDLRPFSYFLSLDAEIYSPDQGDSKFGIVPGAGAELLLSDHLRVGLAYQHDFVFSDENIDVDRFTAKVQFKF